MSDEIGTVYVIHFKRPFGHARHYVGWAKRLDQRLAHHRSGNGARLMASVSAAGIPWWVTRTWQASRTFERRLKGHSGTRYCPECNPGAMKRMVAP